MEELLDTMVELIGKTIPADHQCNCKLNKKPDCNDEECQKCYGVTQLRRIMVKAAVEAGRMDLLVDMLAAAMSGDDEPAGELN